MDRQGSLPDGEASDTEIAKATAPPSRTSIATAAADGADDRHHSPHVRGTGPSCPDRFREGRTPLEDEAAVEIHSTPIASFSTSDLLAELQRRA